MSDPDELLDKIEAVDLDAVPHERGLVKVKASKVKENRSLPEQPPGYQEPWNRLEDETDLAWEYFRFFRNMGPKRSLGATAEEYGLSVRTLHKYSSEFDWTARAGAYDRHMDRVYQEEYVEGVREMSRRHATHLVTAIETLVEPFQELARRKDRDQESFYAELGEVGLSRLFDLAIKASKAVAPMMTAERLARGAPTEITEVQGEVIHDHQLSSDDQLARVLALLERAGVIHGAVGEADGAPALEAEIVEMDDDDPAEPGA